VAGSGGIRAWVGVGLALVPAPAAAAAWSWVQAHPIAAAGLTVAYEIMVLTASFAAGIAGPVRATWQQRLAESLDQTLHHRFSTFDRRYRTYVVDRWRYIDQRGLATGGFFTPALDDVFVDVSLAHRPPHAVSGDPLGDVPASITERHSIWDFLDRPHRVLLAIVGGPGTGKTTLLRHTARRLCGRRRRRPRRLVVAARRLRGQRRPRRLVVLLYLRNHAAAIAADPGITLAALLRTRLPRDLAATEPERWFESRLAGGDCVVLLDGLDEIAEADHRKAVVDWVEHQVPSCPKCSFVITSRPHGYEANPLNGFAVLQTRRLSDEQVRRFVRSWYLAAEKHSTNANTTDVATQAEENAADLLDRLRRTPTLLDLTHNPLLLTMIANVHRYRGALPGSRADLYKEICEVLLWRRHEAKGLRPQVRGDQQIAVVRELAFHMMWQRQRDLPYTDVLSVFKNVLPRYSSTVTAVDFLTEVDKNGLLIEHENGSYAFTHLTFQEYLAAAHIHESRQPEILTAVVGDPWWRETILLYAAQTDATPIVEACLTADTLPALALAFDCAATAGALDPKCRHRLDVLMSEGIAATAYPARRRLLAGVMVVRQLHTAVQVEGGGQVCTEPVARAVYQLFLDETRNGEAPPAPTGLAESDSVATTGAWSRDALAFIAWLNKHDYTEQPVRLPTPTELAHIPGNQRLRPAWATSQKAPATADLWLPSGTPQRIDSATMHQHLAQDLKSIARLLLLLTRDIRLIALLNQLDPASSLTQELAGARALAGVIARDLALDRTRTLDLARTLTLDLDRHLDLALDRTRTLDLALDRALDHTRYSDLTFYLDRYFDLDLDHYLDPGFDRTLDLARDLARKVARDLDHARTRTRDLARDLDRTRTLRFDPNFDFNLALDHALDLDHHLDRALDLTRDFDFNLNLGRGIDIARHRNLDRARDLDIARALGIDAMVGATEDSRSSIDRIGVVLSRAVNAGRNAASIWRKDRNPEVEFSRAFLEVAHKAPAQFDVQMDDVWDAAATATATLIRPDEIWISTVSNRLLETARPIFTREQSVTAHIATTIRLPALCLAVEAEQTLAAPERGTPFREMAAAITLLERYATGQQAPCETILLAHA
jgi:NACHT domain